MTKAVRDVIPEGFLLGVASSSYQIEGAWNKDGKGESIWDHIVHKTPEYVRDKTNGDVGCDSYHLYKEDVKIIKDIGFDFYRFSICWPRILPDGEGTEPNVKGLEYYNNLIDELLKNGIIPMVTMYHWELPQKLEEKGGWLNPEIVDHFTNYAGILFEHFGDRVKWWVTINEPTMVAVGYGETLFAPALNMTGVGDYLAGHNVLKAHAKTYRLYDKQYRANQKGKVSIALHSFYYLPKTDSTGDQEASHRGMEFDLGWFANPIFGKNGDYPEVMKKYILMRCKEQGKKESRLPTFTKEEINDIKGTADYFAFQHYTSRTVTEGDEDVSPSWRHDSNVVTSFPKEWEKSNLHWFKSFPEGLKRSLLWIKNQYNNPEVLITENGFGDEDETTPHDPKRIEYFQTYLKEALDAKYEDKCNILGYAVWCLMDTFEWTDGHTSKFGLFKVDPKDPEFKRVPKDSAKFWKKLIKTRKLEGNDGKKD